MQSYMSCHFTIANSSDGNNSLNISTTGKLFLTSFLPIYLKGFKPQLSPLNSSQTSLTTHRTTLKLVLTCKSKLFWQMRIWRIVARTPSLSSHRLQPSELSSGTRNLFRKLDSSPSQGAGCEFKSGTWFYPPKKSLLRKFSKLWTLFFFFLLRQMFASSPHQHHMQKRQFCTSWTGWRLYSSWVPCSPPPWRYDQHPPGPTPSPAGPRSSALSVAEETIRTER